MAAEIITVVKVPVSQIAEWIKSQHDLPEKLQTFNLEGENLVLQFKDEQAPLIDNNPLSTPPIENNPLRKRRLHKKRNRMKTRGWNVVGRITNSKGQPCSIYKPFVDALENPQLTAEEQRKKVEAILKANRNRPSDESIQYFLDNTLEYLKTRGQSQ